MDADAATTTGATHADEPWPPTVPSAVGAADVVVARATGPDRLTYLDAVLSQRLRDAPPGTATAALELGPNGEPNGIMDLAVLDDEVVLLVPGPLADDVVGRLAGRTFLSEVVFTVDEDVEVARLRGPGAHEDAHAAGLATPAGTAVDEDGLLRLGDDHGVLLVGPAAAVDEATRRLLDAGAVVGDADDLDGREVLTGRPRAPEEVTRGRLPEELGLLPTHVHLDKGCYPGQEAVARMWQLGRPRRRLAVLRAPAPIDTGRQGDDRPVEVTRAATVAGHHVALGLVHRDTVVGDIPAPGLVVQALVGDGQPVPGHDPSVRRRRDTR